MQNSLPIKIRKNILIILAYLFSVSAVLGQNISLNHAGHIIIEEEAIEEASYFEKEDKKFIRLGKKVFQGNGIYKIKNGYLTLEVQEIATPAVLRLYDESGGKQHKMHFNRVYNPVFSPCKKHMLFFDAQNLVAFNTIDYSVKKFPGSSVFSIDSRGNPIFYDEKNKHIRLGESKVPFENQPHEILVQQDTTYIFSRHSIFSIYQKDPYKIHDMEGTFFQARIHNDEVYFVTKQTEKERFVFTLYHLYDHGSVSVVDTTVYEREIRSLKNGGIPSPLKYGENYKHPIGNSYGAIQQYGGYPYLHAGVDFLGDDYEDVFAVKDGVVKAILTTSGDLHWRLATANEDTPEKTEGYLYAHLIEETIPFTTGDSVYAGEVVGELVPWPGWDFTHIHFARIKDEGNIWDGAWWTTNNPHVDVLELIDTTPPIFRNAIDNDLLAFRDEHNNYLDPEELEGKIRIISKIHDLANTHWKIDVYKIGFEVYDIEDPDSPIIEKTSFAYDFKLDTYITGEYDNMIRETIYSRDETCFSIANYDQREYYQIISNTSGTKEVKEGDKDILFDTKKFPNGKYIIRVWAIDASMNEEYADMTIEIYNEGHIPKYDVIFKVKDKNNEPVKDATITLNEHTNEPGNYHFSDIEPGTYSYIVEKDDYETVEEEVEVVNKDVIEEVYMDIITHEVTFKVDLTRAIHHGLLEGFDCDVHSIKITGSMLDWAKPGSDPDNQVMEKSNNDPLVYGIVHHLETGSYDYKYYSDLLGDGFDGAEWKDGDNRMIEVYEDMLVEDMFGPDDLQVIKSDDINISVYPNPANNNLFVKSKKNIKNIKILGMHGQTIITEPVNNMQYELDVSGLHNGLYFIRIHTSSGISTKKIQIAK